MVFGKKGKGFYGEYIKGRLMEHFLRFIKILIPSAVVVSIWIEKIRRQGFVRLKRG